MMERTLVKSKILAFVAAIIASAPAFAGAPGYLGFSVSIDGGGFFLNPTVKTIRIAHVVPGSPAAKAGIASGDLLVEVEKLQIAGAKANDLKPYLQRDVGQPLNIVIQKPHGILVPAVLIAEPKPAAR
jgi:C-terminal processing protease CtpA/Prc